MENLNFRHDSHRVTNEELGVLAPKVLLRTLGCPLSNQDSKRIRRYLLSNGFEVLDHDDNDCDLFIIATCGFLESEEKRCLDIIKQYEKYPTIVMGCLPSINPDALKGKLVAKTPKDLNNIVEPLRSLGYNVRDFDDEDYHMEPEANSIQVQRGCTSACTYCIIKKAIGFVRSAPLRQIVSQQESMSSDICLHGDEIGSWGADIGQSLPDLLNVLDPAKIKVIKYIEPVKLIEFRESVVDFIRRSTHPRLVLWTCLQSGSKRINKLMNRDFDIDLFGEILDEIKSVNSSVQLYTQLIVGFPTETDEEYMQTIDFVRGRFDHSDLFVFSPRKGTQAYKMDGQLTKEQIIERIVRYKKELESATKIITNSKSPFLHDSYYIRDYAGDIKEKQLVQLKLS